MSKEGREELANIINDLERIRTKVIPNWVQDNSDELSSEGQAMVYSVRELLDVSTNLLDKVKY